MFYGQCLQSILSGPFSKIAISIAFFLGQGLLLNSNLAARGVEPLRISTHPAYPPIMFQINKQPMGIALDVAVEGLKALNVPYELIFSGPWNRVLERARVGHIDMVAGLYFSHERDQYLKYSIPIMQDDTVLFVLKGKELSYNSLEDLKGKLGSANLGASFGVEVDAFLKEHVQVQRVVEYQKNYQLLERGRIDYFIFGLFSGQAHAAKLGFEGKIVALPKPVTTEKVYIAMSEKSSYLYVIELLNEYIKKHVNDAKIEQYYQKNMKAYLEDL